MNSTTKRAALTAAAVVALALALLLTACAPAAESTSETAPQTRTASPASTSATVSPIYPINGDEVETGTVEVQVEVTDLVLTMPSNTNVEGEGHIHFTLDDRPFDMSVEPTITFEDVEPGTHALKIELVQNNTESFEPAVVQEVTFTAK